MAVIDGTTSDGTLFWNEGNIGWFAKEVLCEVLRDHEEELDKLSLRSAC